MTGLTALEVSALIDEYFEKYQEFPPVDYFLDNTTTEKALAKEYNLTKRGDHYTSEQQLDLPEVNNKYRDVEVHRIDYPVLGTRFVVKPKALLHRELQTLKKQLLPTSSLNTQEIFPIYKDSKYNYYLYQFGSTIYRTPCRVSRPTLLINYPSYKSIIEAQNDLSTLPFVNVTYSAISSIKENFNKLQQGQEIIVESQEQLPSSVRINNRAFYSDYQLNDSIEEPFQNNNGNIIINPRYIESQEDLERILMQAQGYSEEYIEWALSNQDFDYYEIIQTDTNQYSIKKSNAKYDIKEMPEVPKVEIPKNKRNDRLDAILDRLENLYGVTFNRVTTQDLMNGNFSEFIQDANSVNAFVLNGQIYINMDRASSDAPIHEISHIILGSLKFTNPTMYYQLVSSVEQLEDYQERLQQFPNRSRSDINEEIFVDLFSKYYSQGLELPIDDLTREKLEYEIEHNIDSAIFPEVSTTRGNIDEIMNSSFEEIMDLFGTCINRDAFIQAYEGQSVYNRKLANLKQQLIERGDLKEYCTENSTGSSIPFVHKHIKIK